MTPTLPARPGTGEVAAKKPGKSGKPEDFGSVEVPSAALELLRERLASRELGTRELVDQVLGGRPWLVRGVVGAGLVAHIGLSLLAVWLHPLLGILTAGAGAVLLITSLARLFLDLLDGETLSAWEVSRTWLSRTLPFLAGRSAYYFLALGVAPGMAWVFAGAFEMGVLGRSLSALAMVLFLVGSGEIEGAGGVREYLGGRRGWSQRSGLRPLSMKELLLTQGAGVLEGFRFAVVTVAAAFFGSLAVDLLRPTLGAPALLGYLLPVVAVLQGVPRLLMVWALELLWVQLPELDRGDFGGSGPRLLQATSSGSSSPINKAM